VRRLLLIALPSIALLLLACPYILEYTHPSEKRMKGAGNSPGSGKSPVARIDACSHITREEVEATVDRTVMEATRGDELVSRKEGSLTSSCMFGSDEGYVSLDIKQQDPASDTVWDASQSYKELKDLIGEGFSGQSSVKLEEVAGVGTHAFAQTNRDSGNYGTTELRVLIKGAILTIRVSLPPPPSTLDAAKTLAGKVVPRLEGYVSDLVVAVPDSQPTEPKPKVKLDEDERRQSPKGSQAQQKGKPEVERASPQKAGKVASVKGGARQTDEPSSKGSQKTTKRTAGRSKEETKKTDRPSPKNKKRS
jgi:hypothetical protein